MHQGPTELRLALKHRHPGDFEAGIADQGAIRVLGDELLEAGPGLVVQVQAGAAALLRAGLVQKDLGEFEGQDGGHLGRRVALAELVEILLRELGIAAAKLSEKFQLRHVVGEQAARRPEETGEGQDGEQSFHGCGSRGSERGTTGRNGTNSARHDRMETSLSMELFDRVVNPSPGGDRVWDEGPQRLVPERMRAASMAAGY